MKKLFYLVALFICATLPLMGQSLIFNGDTVNGPLCMIDDNQQQDTIVIDTATWRAAKDTIHSWYSRGDIKILESSHDSVVYFKSTGAGKGSINFSYYKNECGNYVYSANIYKVFNPTKYDLSIQGPDCLTKGDTVVFSVDPIFTKNLGDFIGIDSYYWNITETPRPTFVDSIIYVSGDGSSITFVVGEVTDADSVEVYFGRCNNEDPNKRVVKYLGKAAPKPEINPICIPFGSPGVQVSVANPIDGVIYHWTCDDDQWGFEQPEGAEVTLVQGNTSSPMVTVTASYEGGEVCRASQTSIKVARSWGNDVSVTSDVQPQYELGKEYTFKVEGEVTGGGLKWTAPAGWKGVFYNGQSATMKPNNALEVKLHDSLFVEAVLTCADEGVDRRKFDVYVKPAKVTNITDNGCLIAGTSYKIKITDWELGPKATAYKWLVGDSVQSNYTGDSLIWEAESGIQTISVIPRGAMYEEGHYYWGDTATFALTFQPTPPDSIIAIDTCLFSGQPIETTLSIQTPIPGQTYHWSVPQGWNITCDGADSSSVTYSASNVYQGIYPISIWTTSNGVCDVSDSLSYSINVDTIVWSITYTYYEDLDVFSFKLLKDGEPNSEKKKADWYIDDEISPRKTNQLACSLEESEPLPRSVRAVLSLKGCSVSISWNRSLTMMAPVQRQAKQNSQVQKMATIFPNPTSGIVSIKLLEEKKYLLDVISSTGQLCMEDTIKGPIAQVDISSLNSGVYYFVIIDGQRQETKKIIIKK